MKKKADNNPEQDPDMKSEYDFGSMKGGVRGEFVERMHQRSNVVLLEDDVAAAFPNAKSVNDALRALLRAAEAIKR